MIIDIVGGSYKNKYIAMNGQRTINWYIVKDLIQSEEGEGSKYKHALFPTPGLTSFAYPHLDFNRGIFTARTLTYNRCFIVFDNYLYEIDQFGTLTNRGQMQAMTLDPTSVYMEVNGNNQLMIAHSSASYIFNLDTNTLSQITDSNFPGNVTSLSYMAGYFVITSGGRVYYSTLNDGTSWPAVNVFTPIAKADNTVAIKCWRDDIHCFGSETIELYLNDGASPFSKQDRSTIDIGLVATDTLQSFHQGMVFLGRSRYGELGVYFYNGGDCALISPPSINWQISNPQALSGTTWDQLNTYTWNQWDDPWSSSISNAYALIEHGRDGQIFYYLTIPLLHTTFVYDFSSKVWTERQSNSPLNSTDREFRGKYFTNFSGLNLFLDVYSSKVFKEDYTTALEDSLLITRTRISQIISQENKFVSLYSCELDVNSGIGSVGNPAISPAINLYISKDNGNTYSTIPLSLYTGTTGQYTKRAKATKLGTARNWVLKFVTTDASDLMIQSAIVHGVVGSY